MPDRPRFFLRLALAALLAGGRSAAAHESPAVRIADLTRRITAHPECLALRLTRGELQRIQGDFAGAQGDYDAVARRDPALPGLAVCRAALDLDLGDARAARRLLDPELAARPCDSAALRLRARALEALGDRRAAIA